MLSVDFFDDLDRILPEARRFLRADAVHLERRARRGGGRWRAQASDLASRAMR
jgi:hypothetical protein